MSELVRHTDGGLYVERRVGPARGHEQHVPSLLHTLERTSVLRRDPLPRLVDRLLRQPLSHHLVVLIRRLNRIERIAWTVDEPALSTVELVVEGVVVDVEGRARVWAAEEELRVEPNGGLGPSKGGSPV